MAFSLSSIFAGIHMNKTAKLRELKLLRKYGRIWYNV